MSSLEKEFEYHRKVQLLIKIFEEAVDSIQERDEENFVADLVSMFEGASLALIAKGNLYDFVKTVTGQTGEQIGKSWSNILVAADIRRIADAFAYAYEKIESVGADPHQVGSSVLEPILKGIGEGPFDENIQDKWKKLLASCIAGKNIRSEYLEIMKNLDPIDAKILDTVYGIHNIKLNDLLNTVGISEVELEISILKISEDLNMTYVANNKDSKLEKGNAESTRSILNTSKAGRSCIITDIPESVLGTRTVIHFTHLGTGFMDCVTQVLESNPPSDTSSPISAN